VARYVIALAIVACHLLALTTGANLVVMAHSQVLKHYQLVSEFTYCDLHQTQLWYSQQESMPVVLAPVAMLVLCA